MSHSISLQSPRATIHSSQQLPTSRFICTSTCPQTTSPPVVLNPDYRVSFSLSLSYSFANTYIAGFFLGLVLLLYPLCSFTGYLSKCRSGEREEQARGCGGYYHSLTESCWWLDYVQEFKASQGRIFACRCKPRPIPRYKVSKVSRSGVCSLTWSDLKLRHVVHVGGSLRLCRGIRRRRLVLQLAQGVLHRRQRIYDERERSRLTLGLLAAPALTLVQGQVPHAVVRRSAVIVVCQLLERCPSWKAVPFEEKKREKKEKGKKRGRVFTNACSVSRSKVFSIRCKILCTYPERHGRRWRKPTMRNRWSKSFLSRTSPSGTEAMDKRVKRKDFLLSFV